MAKKVMYQLVDDLDHTELADGSGETVIFSLDGSSYEIDLSRENAAKLRSALQPFVAVARKRGRSRAGSARKGSGRDLVAIRTWARSNGHTVSDRGRVSIAILQAYDEAHA